MDRWRRVDDSAKLSNFPIHHHPVRDHRGHNTGKLYRLFFRSFSIPFFPYKSNTCDKPAKFPANTRIYVSRRREAQHLAPVTPRKCPILRGPATTAILRREITATAIMATITSRHRVVPCGCPRLMGAPWIVRWKCHPVRVGRRSTTRTGRRHAGCLAGMADPEGRD